MVQSISVLKGYKYDRLLNFFLPSKWAKVGGEPTPLTVLHLDDRFRHDELAIKHHLHNILSGRKSVHSKTQFSLT